MGLALERVGIRRYFTHLFTSRELGAAKPDPRFFQAIVRHLGLRPEEALMVGKAGRHVHRLAAMNSFTIAGLFGGHVPIRRPAVEGQTVVPAHRLHATAEPYERHT